MGSLSEKTLLIDKSYLLEKFHMKGGWTYAAIPEFPKNISSHFGLVKVSGKIDDYEFEDFNLMPMRDGVLFLAVKTEIRKIIGKNEGDMVHIQLYTNELPIVLPEDFLLCLNDEPIAKKKFDKLTNKEQKDIIDWIYSVKSDDLKIERILQTLDKLSINK